MQAKEASERLGITQRMLRHYEKQGLMSVGRTLNGYRRYNESDLRRAGRIRDFIATGFSTREIRAMSACLSDDGSGPCEGGIEKMLEKLEHIERLRADLDDRRTAVLERLAVLKNGISSSDESVETMETTTGPFVRREKPADLSAADPR
ncbi:DNA-binding transcriptional regulator, MerR family [Octadecabacter temperatus]|uniref:Zinc-responsive transcriptional regulator n=1 Tax=Octadecabacter temperatus TaxID=1458307 RepID=A0A0K0Y4R9_9RHOB|nr:MerR family transcriptional regulator [Octadecabacter temperatus]AKS45954.1 zinc-responsive transcriptional regulator [Octadecabacter temperatus]SIO04313.1 DNA-binding transcriptional regulator, MerR family [Octadecabacter temperatus]